MSYPTVEFTFNRKKWKVKMRKELRDDSGAVCYGLLDPETRTIWLDASQTTRDRRSTLLHELTHLAVPDLSEDAVCRLERLANMVVGRAEKGGMLK